jgi:hypothetical protein
MKTCNKCKTESDKYYQIANSDLYECFNELDCNEKIYKKELELKKQKEQELYKKLIRKTYYIKKSLVVTFIDGSNPDSYPETYEYTSDLYKRRINCIDKSCNDRDDNEICNCIINEIDYSKEVLYNRKPYDDDGPMLNELYTKEINKIYNNVVGQGEYFLDFIIIKIVLEDTISQDPISYNKYIDSDFDYLT